MLSSKPSGASACLCSIRVRSSCSSRDRMQKDTADRDWLAPGLGLGDMLARVAEELGQLSVCADGLQDLIGQLLAITGLPRDFGVQRDLQSIDQMIQRLN